MKFDGLASGQMKSRKGALALIREFSRLDVLVVFTSVLVPTMIARLIFNPKQAFRARIAFPENQ